MNTIIINGQRKNIFLDIVAWLIVLGILAGTPFIVGAVRVPPALGPIKDPSILIIFLTLMGLITLSGLTLYGFLYKGKSDTDAGINVLNFHAKFIGALFLISGFVKLQDPVGFAYKLDEYWDVFQTYLSIFPNTFMKSYSVPFAAVVSVIEVTLAIALMTGWKMRITSTLMLLMIIFFTFLTGFSAITGAVTDCGCFGDALKLTPWESFGKDILLTLAIFPIFRLRKGMTTFYRRNISHVVTLLALFVPAGISYYCYQHYPLLDFRGAYVVGQNLKYNVENFDEEEGQTFAHDFYEFGSECGHDGFQGPTLYIIMYNLAKVPVEALDAAAKLTSEIKQKAPGIFVAGGTNIGANGRKAFPLKFEADFCWSSQDEKVLKTIVRSSPGYLLMKDGIILKKWHYNDIPTIAELKTLSGPAAMVPLPPVVLPVDSTMTDSTAIDSAKIDSGRAR
jgi:uncharacterized membrane protein YphA (DoxX/SURF4 family)